MKTNLLFSCQKTDVTLSALILALRLFFGIMLITHGYAKMMNFDALSATFADPLGVGSHVSLLLAIFAEVVCAVAFIFGFLFRLAVLPMIVTMAVAFFVVHGGTVAHGELALVYLVVFTLLLLVGPGRFSLDAILGRRLFKCSPHNGEVH